MPWEEAAANATASVLGAGATNALIGGGASGGDLERGYRKETNAYKIRQQYNFDKAEERGLTPQEFYGSSAAGGSAPSGGGQTLGNSATQRNIATMQMGAQMGQKEADRQVAMRGQDMQLEQTKLQTGQQKYNTDTQNAVNEGRLKLDRDTFQHINLPTASAKLGLTEQQTKKLINEVATSNQHFVVYMKKLSMGVDNMLSEMYQSMNGFDVTKPDTLLKHSPQERQALLAGMLALQSKTAKEFAGAQANVSNTADSTIESLISIFSGTGSGIEAAKPTLGEKTAPQKYSPKYGSRSYGHRPKSWRN